MSTIGAALVGGAWLWDKFGEKAIDRASKSLSEAGRRTWEKIDWKGAAERYRQEMQMSNNTMRIIGMTEPVALADIFTDVFVLDKPTAWRRYNIDELRRQSKIKEPDEIDLVRRHALDLVQRHERLFILGKPGAGKTTLLKYLVLQCTTGKLDRVPIFVGLKAWADSGLKLMPFITQQFAICNFPDAQLFIAYILAEGRAMVLFDGLDEVNLEQGKRQQITDEVRDFANRYNLSRCVITCRTAATDYQFDRFAYCELADFTTDQMRNFVTNWFQRDKVKQNAFLIEFAKDEHAPLRDLARTPLLLTLLCLAFQETMTFPPRRAELYEEALDALLKRWDATRSIKRDVVYRYLSIGHKRQMLARIAAETFGKNELFMRQDNLAQRIKAYLQLLPASAVEEEIDGQAILREMEAQHGILVERAQRIFSFSHLTFHEYFTARYTVEHPSEKMFRSVTEHAYDARWREVLLLTASLLDEANAELFFNTFDAVLRAMVKADSQLLLLFLWIDRKTKRTLEEEQILIRRSYLVLALIRRIISTYVEILNRTSAGALSQARAIAGDRVRALARNLMLVSNHSLTEASDRALSLAHALDLDRYIDIEGAIDIVRDSTLDLTLGLVHSLADNTDRLTTRAFRIDCIWTSILIWIQVLVHIDSVKPIDTDYDTMSDLWHEQIMLATPGFQEALVRLSFPEKGAPLDNWKQFGGALQVELETHRDIGQAWILDTKQLEHLADYLSASTRFLECLNLATVADRDAIRNRLLLPPQP